jgi:hypothetical protein
VLNKVDPQLLSLYFDQILSYSRHRSKSASISEDGKRDDVQTQNVATRALEVSITLAGGEGDDATLFGRRLLKILNFLGEGVRMTVKEAKSVPVQQDLAEMVLFFVQKGERRLPFENHDLLRPVAWKASNSFQMKFVDSMVQFLAECDIWTYRTTLVIACAVLAEYLPKTGLDKVSSDDVDEQRLTDIISVLSNLFVQANESRKSSCSITWGLLNLFEASLQELLLLTILRLFAEVGVKEGEPPDMNLENVRHSVKEVRNFSTTRKYIRSV